MSNTWETFQFGEICTLQRGFDLPKRLREAGVYPLVSSSGVIDSHTAYKVKGPGVVTGRSGSIGNVFYVEESYWPLNTCLYVKDFHGNDPRFIYYFLDHMDLSRFASGAGVPTLNRNNVHVEEVLLTKSKKQQKRIVAILGEAFASIDQAKANTERNLANARELFDSYLNRVFDDAWGKYNIVSLAELAVDITDGDHSAPPKSREGVPFITISNIDKSSRIIDFRNTFKVPRSYYDGLKPNRKPRKNDVLYTVTGSFGIPVLVDSDIEFCFQRHIGLIRPCDNVDPKWLYYLCLTPQVFGQASDRATGTAQKTVSLKVLRSLEVPKLDYETQRTMVPLLERVDSDARRIHSVYTDKLAVIDELKQSILKKAFSGELTNKPDKVLNELGV